MTVLFCRRNKKLQTFLLVLEVVQFYCMCTWEKLAATVIIIIIYMPVWTNPAQFWKHDGPPLPLDKPSKKRRTASPSNRYFHILIRCLQQQDSTNLRVNTAARTRYESEQPLAAAAAAAAMMRHSLCLCSLSSCGSRLSGPLHVCFSYHGVGT